MPALHLKTQFSQFVAQDTQSLLVGANSIECMQQFTSSKSGRRLFDLRWAYQLVWRRKSREEAVANPHSS